MIKHGISKMFQVEFSMALVREKFPKIFASFLLIPAMSGSVYVCEEFFSTMKINKYALHSRPTDEHLQSVLRLNNLRDVKLNMKS